ncbi:Metallo-hydrolase/oxidoreductase superfamily protein [Quillaja saponaria]|uniref:Metallo-hydrolase/oxidoreductase superfamily protein n=1 Tax=Quillaja saponaria TaxID=32244 RepID=A0AAD7P5Y1_QUISA|nr:Metallo-hydrolase/oxidoreductase superfamily protein [Quillaja saponaria]
MAAIQCNSLLCFSKPRNAGRPLNPLFSSNRSISTNSRLLCKDSTSLKTLTTRSDRIVSAVISEDNAIGSSFSATDVFKLTYLEGNSWLWNVGEANILVDPILVGNLDFGIPWLYDASKKVLTNFQLSDLPEIDCLLITQSLDDHCHLKTLKPLAEKFSNLRVIATPNAKSLLDPLFKNVTYIEPGQTSVVETSYGSNARVQATAGPVLGPPWQCPENGYLIKAPQGQLTLYYEPHCVYNQNFLEKERADIVITPVIKQLLPKFTLVSGQEDAVKLAKLLQAKFIVPMKNGDLESKGLLSSIIESEGTIESFKELLSKELPDARVLEPTPGLPLEISAANFPSSSIQI